MNESKSLCMIPWLHRFTNEQGWHQVCCSGEGPANTIHDEQGRALRVDQGLTDSQILNSPDLKAIRLAMLQGKWPAVCERCRRSEEAGAVSIRNHITSRFGHWRESALGQTAEDGTLTHPQVRYADIRLGNACNLTCRMCGPAASRLWADHYNEVQPVRHRLPVLELNDLRENNWVKSRPVQWLMEQCIPSVESLHFAGGEPLIIPEMIEALEFCVRSGRADQIDLSYNTNITVLPERATRLWPHFRSVSLVCSVDAFGRLNEYIRRPCKWSDVDRNLRVLDRHFVEWKIRGIICSATVQIYNILQLGELFDYLASGFEHIAPLPQLVPLYEPRYLSIQILPARVKNIARGRLVAERAKAEALPQRYHFLLSAIDTILTYLDGTAYPAELIEFFQFSEKSDREFGDSWRQACPELAGLLGFPDRAKARQ